METQVGVVKARELWAWDRSDLPGPALASEIRAIVVKRRRPTFDELWRTPIQVRLPEDWRRALPDSERLRLARLVETADAVASFPAMTLRDLKDGLALSVADTLGVLAKIEALYWISVPTQSSTSPASQGHADVPVGQEFLDQVRSCLSATWVAELQSDDLRFPHIEGRPLPSWLDPQLGTSRLTSLAHGLCERLIAAHRATWAVELADVALHAIERADKRRPGSEEAKTRWINIFLARYGNGNGQTLQEVGDAHSLTRERVRQICDAILSSITAQSVKMPALERVLAAAGRIMPLSMEEASAQLRRLLGEGPGLGAAMHFAEAVGVASTVQHAELKARTNEGYKLVPMIESIAAPSTWMTAALSFARKDCTFVGCSNFLRIAGYLALNQGIAQDLDTLRTLFEGAPGYRVLDAESGWFTLADSETSAAATRMRKLMSVAGGSAELDTVAAALMTDDRWFYREGGNAMAVPPLHVLSELFGGWEWLNANAHNKYVAKAPIDAESVLSATELGAVKVIERHGGAATRAEIASHLIEALGFSNVAVSATLAMSPALAKLEKSIYSIRGVPVPANGLTQARGRRARERVGLSGSDRPTDQKLDEAAEPRSTPRISSE
ncbi:hypothetical protein LJR175_008225 [Variovorax sp. LjRoot175]|uniref:sigma factor-like helix-turn-helix DNA-binding protein n=1 Tax=Variovorax sp. LjRoot175 TaxID=3342276 RepID=UPI003ED1185C